MLGWATIRGTADPILCDASSAYHAGCRSMISWAMMCMATDPVLTLLVVFAEIHTVLIGCAADLAVDKIKRH